jgi:predicted PurR-regulated permease PerM
LLIALAAALALIVVPLAKEGTELMKALPTTMARFDSRIEPYRREFPWLERLLPVQSSPEAGAKAAQAPALAKKAIMTASAALEGGATALAVFFLGLFLAWDPERWLRGVVELWPGPAVEERIELLRKVGGGLRTYLLTLGITMVLMAAAWAGGLWIIGIKYSLLFGAIAGLAEVVPYVGPMLGLIPPLLVSFTGGTGKVLYVLLLYAILHVVEGYILVPYIMQRGTHLPPPLVVFSILVFGTLFGTLGVILAVPLGTVIYLWVNERVYTRHRADSEIITTPAQAA